MAEPCKNLLINRGCGRHVADASCAAPGPASTVTRVSEALALDGPRQRWSWKRRPQAASVPPLEATLPEDFDAACA